jgi:hypothetical protein
MILNTKLNKKHLILLGPLLLGILPLQAVDVDQTLSDSSKGNFSEFSDETAPWYSDSEDNLPESLDERPFSQVTKGDPTYSPLVRQITRHNLNETNQEQNQGDRSLFKKDQDHLNLDTDTPREWNVEGLNQWQGGIAFEPSKNFKAWLDANIRQNNQTAVLALMRALDALQSKSYALINLEEENLEQEEKFETKLEKVKEKFGKWHTHRNLALFMSKEWKTIHWIREKFKGMTLEDIQKSNGILPVLLYQDNPSYSQQSYNFRQNKVLCYKNTLNLGEDMLVESGSLS